MKTFVGFVFVVCACLALVAAKSDQKKKLKKYKDECKAEVNATDADVKMFFNNSKDLTTPTAKCFAGCFYEKNKIIRDGALSVAKYEKLIKNKYTEGARRTHAQTMLAGCAAASAAVGKDRCLMAPILRRCIPTIFKKKQDEDDDDDDDDDDK